MEGPAQGGDRAAKWMTTRSADGEGPIAAQLARGNRLVAERKWDKAAAAYDPVRREHPNDPQVRYAASRAAVRARRRGRRQRGGERAGGRSDRAVLDQGAVTADRCPRGGPCRPPRRRRPGRIARIVDDYEHENAVWAAQVGLVTPYRRRWRRTWLPAQLSAFSFQLPASQLPAPDPIPDLQLPPTGGRLPLNTCSFRLWAETDTTPVASAFRREVQLTAAYTADCPPARGIHMNLRAIAILLLYRQCELRLQPIRSSCRPNPGTSGPQLRRRGRQGTKRDAQFGNIETGGDASWIPLVIEALRRSRMPRADLSGARYVSQCVRRHCESSPTWTPPATRMSGRRGTTREQGTPAASVAARREFKQRRFPVADPIDRAFAAAIDASVPEYQPAFIRVNALRLLQGLPFDVLRPDLEALLASTSSRDRRGVVAALEEPPWARHDRVCFVARAADADLDVAENALRALNVETPGTNSRQAPLKGMGRGPGEGRRPHPGASR